jgi:hypothetical protein
MFDVLGGVETGGDFQPEHFDVKTPAALNVVALKRAMGKSLRHVTATRKSLAI